MARSSSPSHRDEPWPTAPGQARQTRSIPGPSFFFFSSHQPVSAPSARFQWVGRPQTVLSYSVDSLVVRMRSRPGGTFSPRTSILDLQCMDIHPRGVVKKVHVSFHLVPACWRWPSRATALRLLKQPRPHHGPLVWRCRGPVVPCLPRQHRDSEESDEAAIGWAHRPPGQDHDVKLSPTGNEAPAVQTRG